MKLVRGLRAAGAWPKPQRADRLWPNGQRAALSVSFDDARPSQLRRGLPVFDRLDIRVTFFVLPDPVAESAPGWREAVARGHEIGNHTMTHPCSGNFAWTRANALELMSLADFTLDIEDANRCLRDVLDLEPVVFAYPCGQTFVGRGRDTKSLVPLIAEMFTVGRTFNDVVANSPTNFDPAQVACVNCDGRTLDGLLPALEAALDDNAWLVLGGHEIGPAGDHETTMPATIEAVVGWCRRNEVWIDTIGTVALAAASLQEG